jgi:arginine decarboxylase-like protein
VTARPNAFSVYAELPAPLVTQIQHALQRVEEIPPHIVANSGRAMTARALCSAALEALDSYLYGHGDDAA